MADNFYATPEEIARVDAALTKTQGNRKHAAIALGLDPKKVYDMVCDNGPLAAKWGKKHPDAVEPGPDTDIHREPGLRPMEVDEQKVVEALNKEDALLGKGLTRLGFNTKEKRFLQQLSQTYRSSFSSVLDLAHGGAAQANVRLLLVLENLTEKLADIEANPSKYELRAFTKDGTSYVAKSANDYSKEFHALVVAVASELRRAGETALKANALRMKFEQMRQQNNGPKKVAGWTVEATK